MNYEKLQKILAKSNIKVTVIGFIIVGLGVLIFLIPSINGKGSFIGAAIVGGIFSLLGLLALKNSLPKML